MSLSRVLLHKTSTLLFYTKGNRESNISRHENEKTFGVFESDDGSLFVRDHDDSVR